MLGADSFTGPTIEFMRPSNEIYPENKLHLFKFARGQNKNWGSQRDRETVLLTNGWRNAIFGFATKADGFKGPYLRGFFMGETWKIEKIILMIKPIPGIETLVMERNLPRFRGLWNVLG
jgi:hypothetical protein